MMTSGDEEFSNPEVYTEEEMEAVEEGFIRHDTTPMLYKMLTLTIISTQQALYKNRKMR